MGIVPNPEDASKERGGPSAWDVALRLLGVRARSRHEMRERLTRRGFDADTIDDVMTRLDRHQLLDDADFASEWVRSRHTHSGKGRIALRHELQHKGIDPGVIDSALAEVDDADERLVARALVDRKLTQSALDRLDGDPGMRDKLFRRLAGMLVRRGYPQSMAVDVVKEALSSTTS